MRLEHFSSCVALSGGKVLFYADRLTTAVKALIKRAFQVPELGVDGFEAYVKDNSVKRSDIRIHQHFTCIGLVVVVE